MTLTECWPTSSLLERLRLRSSPHHQRYEDAQKPDASFAITSTLLTYATGYFGVVLFRSVRSGFYGKRTGKKSRLLLISLLASSVLSGPAGGGVKMNNPHAKIAPLIRRRLL